MPALEGTTELIDGFESPLGMELLATIDWLTHNEGVAADRVKTWPGGKDSAERKVRLFEDRLIDLALERLATFI
jgi:hypothetical protein